jgi:hypothetical protein
MLRFNHSWGTEFSAHENQQVATFISKSYKAAKLGIERKSAKCGLALTLECPFLAFPGPLARENAAGELSGRQSPERL